VLWEHEEGCSILPMRDNDWLGVPICRIMHIGKVP